jgi:hypothetical protein
MIDPNKNSLLKSLPEATKKSLFPQFKIVKLPLGKVIYESG